MKPDLAEAYSNLGNALTEAGAVEDAIVACRRAIELNPDLAEAHSNLGNALIETGSVDDAIAAYCRAIALKPGFAQAYSNLGSALDEAGAVDAAIDAFHRAIALKPDFAEAHSNLGVSLQKVGQLDEAVAACRQAVALQPGYAEGHYNLAHMLLVRGDYAQGWAEHEWRWRVKGYPSPPWNTPQPRWDGGELAQGTILLHCEQGFGDAIQFIRYVPLAAERCGRVVVMCWPQLHRLFQSIPGVAQWVTPDEPLPPFDAQCPLMSLSLVLGTTLETIPSSVPYLKAAAGEIERWRERLAHDPAGFKVGLAWAGRRRTRMTATGPCLCPVWPLWLRCGV